jgi:hypothetical protein
LRGDEKALTGRHDDAFDPRVLLQNIKGFEHEAFAHALASMRQQ